VSELRLPFPIINSLWQIVWLSILATGVSITRIPLFQARAFVILTCAVDIGFMVVVASRFAVASDIIVVAFFSLLTFRMMFLRVSYVAESLVRNSRAG
jgi:hypothetical protein